MLTDFNWIDIAIIIVMILSLLMGIKSGLIKSIFTIVGIAAGLTVAVINYAALSNMVLFYIDMPWFIADSVSFFLLFLITALIIHWLGTLFALVTQVKLLKFADKLGGGGAGLLFGAVLVGTLLILLAAFPIFSSFQDDLDHSTLAQPLIGNTELVYEHLSELLSINAPRLAFHPEDSTGYHNNKDGNTNRHPGVNFRELDGATCFVCGNQVEFVGYLNNNMGSVSPKFICTYCGRTSDGCQTYEGYHLMYDQCPVELGNKGYRLDCGVWTNNSYHRPTGPCPVCDPN